MSEQVTMDLLDDRECLQASANGRDSLQLVQMADAMAEKENTIQVESVIKNPTNAMETLAFARSKDISTTTKSKDKLGTVKRDLSSWRAPTATGVSSPRTAQWRSRNAESPGGSWRSSQADESKRRSFTIFGEKKEAEKYFKKKDLQSIPNRANASKQGNSTSKDKESTKMMKEDQDSSNVWRPSAFTAYSQKEKSDEVLQQGWRARLAAKGQTININLPEKKHKNKSNAFEEKINLTPDCNITASSAHAVVTNYQTRDMKMSHPLKSSLETLVLLSNEEVVCTLFQPENKFETLIEEKLPQESFILIMKLLQKVCLCDTKSQEKSCILSSSCQQKFLDQFINQIMNFKEEKSTVLNTHFENIATYFENVLFLLPFTALDRAASQITACHMYVSGLKKDGKLAISDETLEKFEFIYCELNKLKMKADGTNIADAGRKERKQQLLPPDDFRSLNMYPTAVDVVSNKTPFLRPNLVSGQYKDTEHYLDVQFRLLREDFLRPLREGIADYLAHGNTHNSSVRVYKDVSFQHTTLKIMDWTVKDESHWFPEVVPRKPPYYKRPEIPPFYGQKVFLNSDKKFRKKINWSKSKRLMHGTLLCFTKNNFKTVLFGTVSHRDEISAKGCVYIQFCQNVDEDIFSSNYLMLESEVFFEPYFHVMNVLRQMNAETLPMAKYLVEVTSEQHTPGYLLQSSLKEKGVCFTIRGVDNSKHEVLLLDETTWPSCETLGMNPSQLQAFRGSLTQELAVIQGPPGTGKTFLALKLAEALIENKCSTAPIIVVCLTNHALDQFLLGILKYTKNVVRIGGQSKIEALDAYNIRNLRVLYRGIDSWFEKLEINHLENVMVYFESFLTELEWNMERNIVAFSTFQDYGVIKKSVLHSLQDDYVEWLMDEESHLPTKIIGETKQENQFFKLLIKSIPQLYDFSIDGIEEFYEDFDLRNYHGQIYDKQKNHCVHRVLTVLLAKIKNLETKLVDEDDEESTLRFFEDIENQKMRLSNIKLQLTMKRQPLDPSIAAKWEAGNLWRLSHDQRWQLYWYWVDQLVKSVLIHIDGLRRRIYNIKQGLHEWPELAVSTLSKKDVIGLTTTGSARLHDRLQRLKPEIVIVEEAAEVLESHIVASLSESCKHLILIGDHKQLRPSTSVYQLARQYDFDVSLFERMVQGRGGCMTLNVQHRMSPCIARLVCPSIYPQLENHESTEQLEPVKGLPKRLFFLTHAHPEETIDSDTKSHSNEFEAVFLVALCDHLIRQGYGETSITILTTYTGQMFLIQEKTKKSELCSGVRVTVVDNFQGEENDIILLSLVRSNEHNNIGFLATENRVCVALSRARNGLYIIGNMECLARADNIWMKVKSVLEDQDAIGPALPISCQIHPENSITNIATPEDFQHLSPLGGCTKPCLENLPCGHPCGRPCHVQPHILFKCVIQVDKLREICQHINAMYCYQNPEKTKCQMKCVSTLKCGHECRSTCHIPDDPDHEERYSCMAPCPRKHNVCGHACSRRCGQECGDCQEIVTIALPSCGHNKDVECSKKNVTDVFCTEMCVKTRECGHSIEVQCGTVIESVCKEKYIKLLDCGHAIEIECARRGDLIICEEICRKLLSCGHWINTLCKAEEEVLICNVECQNILQCGHKCLKKCHEICRPCKTSIVTSLLTCGHEKVMECGDKEKENWQQCYAKCGRILGCGHLCIWPCCGTDECKPCIQKVIKVLAECKHNIMAACSEDPCAELCQKPCKRTLECGHPCEQKCGEICICFRLTNITVVNKCGHNINLLCSEISDMTPGGDRQCSEPCGVLLRCGHICAGTCGACMQGRLHVPCTQPCRRTLVCGHSCVAVCNEPCPPCQQPCRNVCEHAPCKNMCGDRCTKCKLPCTRHCDHMSCNRRCRAKCLVAPCNEPCTKLLNCQHPCMGLCGEPCPPVCVVCTPQILQEFSQDLQMPSELRLLQIPGCGHVVSESALKATIKDSLVSLPECPRCKNFVVISRYSVENDRAFEVILFTKCEQLNSFAKKSPDRFLDIMAPMNLRVERIINDVVPSITSQGCNTSFETEICKRIQNFSKALESCSLIQLREIEIELCVLLSINSAWKTSKMKEKNCPLLDTQSAMLLAFIERHRGAMGQQQVEDLRMEVLRLRRIMQHDSLKHVSKKIKTCIGDKNKKSPETTEHLHPAQHVLEESAFDDQLEQLFSIVNDGLPYSLEKENNAAHLFKSLFESMEIITCNSFVENLPLEIFTEFEISPIPDVLDMSKDVWYKCPKGDLSLILDRNDLKCFICTFELL